MCVKTIVAKTEDVFHPKMEKIILVDALRGSEVAFVKKVEYLSKIHIIMSTLGKKYKLYLIECVLSELLAPTCKKEQYKDYYTEHGCRSRRPLKIAACVGSCGDTCCTPKRSRRRRVRLICNDGTRYTKDVEIIRKCACSKKCY